MGNLRKDFFFFIINQKKDFMMKNLLSLNINETLVD